MILYYLCFRSFPFEGYFEIGDKREEIENAIINNQIQIPPNLFSNSLNDVLTGLLEKDEKKRMSLDYVMEHLFGSEKSQSNNSSPNVKKIPDNHQDVL